jgi:hypothetical protein
LYIWTCMNLLHIITCVGINVIVVPPAHSSACELNLYHAIHFLNKWYLLTLLGGDLACHLCIQGSTAWNPIHGIIIIIIKNQLKFAF